MDSLSLSSASVCWVQSMPGGSEVARVDCQGRRFSRMLMLQLFGSSVVNVSTSLLKLNCSNTLWRLVQNNYMKGSGSATIK